MDEARPAKPLDQKADFVLHLVTIEIVQQKTEFIPANPRQHVGGPDIGAQGLGKMDEQRIADPVAMGIIDRFQIVDIEKQHGTIVTISLTAGNAILQTLNKKAAI